MRGSPAFDLVGRSRIVMVRTQKTDEYPRKPGIISSNQEER
jgi:hypothetical protein